jgi:hypothetical protein
VAARVLETKPSDSHYTLRVYISKSNFVTIQKHQTYGVSTEMRVEKELLIDLMRLLNQEFLLDALGQV